MKDALFNDILKTFPDSFKLEFETDVVENKQQIFSRITSICDATNTGLIYYYSHGKKVIAFFSRKMKLHLARMIKGAKVQDPLTGDSWTVVSDKPYIVGGSYCIKVDQGGFCDVFACETFIK